MEASATALAAEKLLKRAQADPIAYCDGVGSLLAEAGDDMAVLHVRWGMGLALRELGRYDDAMHELTWASARASELGARKTAASIQSSLAVVLLHCGQAAQALEQTMAAAAQLDGVDAARNEMQRGLILQRLGRQDEAIQAYDRAVPVLEMAQDRAGLSRLLSNRGILLAYQGNLRRAWADLQRAVDIARDLETVRPLALRLQNLGFVAGRWGRVPEALALFDEANELLAQLGDAAAQAVLDVDRAELLADAGLFDEAVERAEAAVARLDGDVVRHGEAKLLLARFLLIRGDVDRAGDLAEELASTFRDEGRTGWVLHARYLALAARADAVPPADAANLADELETGGWATEARAARLFGARHAIAQGDTGYAAELLRGLRGTSSRAPALARAQHWYATGLARLSVGDRAGTRRAIRAGLNVLAQSRLAFGSAELRAHATAHTVDLVRLGVTVALEDGRAAEALRVLDRVRATDVGVRIRPPADSQLAGDLAALRRLAELERGAAQAGQDVAPILAERAEAEQRVRDRTRAIAAEGGEIAESWLDVAELRCRLDGRTLVAYLYLDGRLHAVEVAARATRHHVLGAVDEVRAHVEHLRASVRRLAAKGASVHSRRAASESLSRSVRDLIRCLALDRFEPQGLTIVPTAPLSGLPWGALVPSLQSVPVIVPSARAWLDAAGHELDGNGTLLVAGPDLPGGLDEVMSLAAQYEDANVLTGDDATVAATLTALQTSSAVHLVAHGRFRADNPLFSSLRLADGQLTVYEFEQLQSVPRLWVLPSCEAAATSTVRGDAVLGLSSVLLRVGAASIIAPVFEVADDATAALMLDLHAGLSAGASPQHALARAILAAVDDGPSRQAAGAAFVVVGS